ncbi:MAG TPA: aminotransferase class IV [Bacteroidales bacterium]|nr:aminotransferase class IV [Bacteroidales bacterium]
MKEYCGNYYVLNGELKNTQSFDTDNVYKGHSIYEVIRLTKGIPVFFNDHMERLETSVRLRERLMPAGSAELRRCVLMLTEKERKKEINIKIVFNYTSSKTSYLVYFIESSYPAPEQYQKGVRTILFYAQRSDPHAKVLDFRLRSNIHQELFDENAYEALLVNDENLITEGSRSNIFFIKGDVLYTAPDDLVLKGITRKYILEICVAEGIKVQFEPVNADDLGMFDSAFICGTSPMVLPICSVNEKYFNTSNSLMSHLRTLYIKKVEESLLSFTNQQQGL